MHNRHKEQRVIDSKISVIFDKQAKSPMKWAEQLGFKREDFLKDCESVITPTDEVVAKLLDYRYNGNPCTYSFKDDGRPKDLTGMRFGRLTVVSKAIKGDEWKCKCDCGNIKYVRRCKLVGKETNSCGCLRREHQSVFINCKKNGAVNECRRIQYKGRELTITEWSRQPEVIALDIKRRNIYSRLRAGWSVERTLTTPNRRKSE